MSIILKNAKSFLILGTLVYFQWGCVEVQHKKDEIKKSDSQPEIKTFSENENSNLKLELNDLKRINFISEVENTRELHNYRLKIKWDRIFSNPIIVLVNGIEYSIKKTSSPLYISIPEGRENVIEMKVELKADTWITLWSQQINSPKDLYVFEPMELAHETHIKVERIFIGEKGKIITNGYPLSIETKDLVSEGGSIETFPLGIFAKDGKDGRTPAPINITTHYARGSLSFVLRGENGGRGLQGVPWETPQPNSASGKDGTAICLPDPVFRNPICSCGKRAQNGGDGLKGMKGGTGFKGGKGGDSGNLNLIIQGDYSEFTYTLGRVPGAGGEPGLGGPGQIGGQPGPGGRTNPPTRSCPDGKPGQFLGNGETGDKGQTGENGVESPYCLGFGSEPHCY